MCKQCTTVKDRVERHGKRTGCVAIAEQEPPYRSVPATPRVLTRDLKVACEVEAGDVIFVQGRYLQPFCSHALYRVRVTDNHCPLPGKHRFAGELIDFKDSPVQSMLFPERQSFRVDMKVKVKA